ncbi:protein affecting phage T7 exclusion by the F plasmid [Mycolicibacterium phlei]|jgi:UPF0716 protein FxsA|uniref:Exlusion protein FxsA n=1 Tax=Mycolicibacterium phlei DSM 43239 = CCUG 21000 TaxID=1226750 RepID=A0A5N5US24_MYCPH|nr:FxsA family protein [Mycolicibacterium phlei]VEG09490.1 protein affecting phage T7 exclusion by the F plasmid [Mycobacteroides chelonae]AMO61376.1 phage T7 F exclusion suppressor FxsA [Mycolicibacterium phlei]EID15385.1 phage T7 F exclusion suppressor FxsA [Mycolicibacterium phlei RIVM601174]KAB7752392.1 exlusion protein FxsA [Mycolicibacterium phlei DSM 43239 = CCUG 21000]KXW60740.1 exlusion protein FxsA [Mycolicibacterium phlei DSM 43239 = CCUG 21000]
MAKRLFLLYVILEIAVMVALAATIGIGWTLLILVATFFLGLVLAGSQLRRQLVRLRSGLTAADVQGAAADSVLVALGTVLVAIPGLATSLLGALLLVPPTRAAARPLLTVLAARRMPLITAAGWVTSGAARTAGRPDYIDGEVVDVIDLAQPAVERSPGPSARHENLP